MNPKFGILLSHHTFDQAKTVLDAAGIKLVRLNIFLSYQTSKTEIDQYLKAGYYVQLNVNWNSPANGAVAFPKDMVLYKSRLESFLEYYAPFKDQFTFLACENELDNAIYYLPGVDDYLSELSVFTITAHQYGFRVTDGGITSNNLRRWVYSKLRDYDAAAWRQQYYVGLENDYQNLINRIDTFLEGFKQIPYRRINTHWYNNAYCANGFARAVELIKEMTGKEHVACNEFGIKTNDLQLFIDTVTEIKDHVNCMIAYSGIDEPGKAIKLSSEMMKLLK